MLKRLYLFAVAILICSIDLFSQHSVAREWNELNLNAIRNDFARPTITARNLWHVSAAMYDAWAAYDLEAETYILGKNVGGYYTPYNGIDIPLTAEDIELAREEAISYAAYRVLSHRYADLPEDNQLVVQPTFDNLMNTLGYAIDFTSTDYTSGNPAALGNYIGAQIIEFGYQDGANELGDYENQYYEPENLGFLIADSPGNPSLEFPNRWQRLLQTLDQNDQEINADFLSPEWGNVTPFSLGDEDMTLFERDENFYKVYCDPGAPPYIDEETDELGIDDEYKKGFLMVTIWSGLLAHDNGVMVDISPNSIGNISGYPDSIEDYDDFYDYFTGGDSSEGYDENPATGMPYDEQIVPLGDYGRVLAEFWADGPDSETPPGHWFSIINYVNDHPDLEKKWNGQGDVVDDLEWDIKTYFTLGATMHDCAISAWGIKGWYDYIRPISAIRYMADRGQSTDMTLPGYHPAGLPLIEGFSELVDLDDPLIGVSQQNLNKVKILAWKGPDYLDQVNDDGEIFDEVADSTTAGVDWILAENWWPYQRPTFITPPFAGYVSGHSTYSRGAAEVLALMTGDEYFPGGMGVFPCPQNNFLVFETGPSVDLELQWAKYKDASDQCSLSRIFGGIHPPADDIPGRIIGQKIGADIYSKVNEIIFNDEPRIIANELSAEFINDEFVGLGTDFSIQVTYNRDMDETSVPIISFDESVASSLTISSEGWVNSNTYEWNYSTLDANSTILEIGFSVSGAVDLGSLEQLVYSIEERFSIDTENPTLSGVSNAELINEANTGTLTEIDYVFSEPMVTETPTINFTNEDPTINTLSLNDGLSVWSDDQMTYTETYLVFDADEELYDINVSIEGLTDLAGNSIETADFDSAITVDTKAPEVLQVSPQGLYMNEQSALDGTFDVVVTFDDDMNQSETPSLSFPVETPGISMTLNVDVSGWTSVSEYTFVFDVLDENVEIENIDVMISGGSDDMNNPLVESDAVNLFTIDTKAPEVTVVNDTDFETLINDDSTGVIDYVLEFSEDMDTDTPQNVFTPQPASLTLDGSSDWLTSQLYRFRYSISDGNEEVDNIMINTTMGVDIAGNPLIPFDYLSPLIIDNKNPCGIINATTYNVTAEQEGENGFQIVFIFDENLGDDLVPQITFPDENPGNDLILNTDSSGWFGTSYIFSFDVSDDLDPLGFIDIDVEGIVDENGNGLCELDLSDFFSIELDTFLVVAENELRGIKVFPNPVSQGTNVTIEAQDIESFDLIMTNGIGQRVEIDVRKNDNDLVLVTRELSAGTYYLKITDGNKSGVYRLVIL